MTDIASEISQHLPRLQRYARSLLHNTSSADDLVQDTVLRALEKAHLFRQDTNLRGWLVTIMHNEHVNAARRRSRGPIFVPDDELAAVGRPQTQETPVELKELCRAVDRLPREQREALLLHWLRGLRYEEIAECLRLPLGTVQSRISRARRNLRTIVETDGADLGLAHIRPRVC
jgi:RNA polymerase sigma-70 factor (ECF subfamily)